MRTFRYVVAGRREYATGEGKVTVDEHSTCSIALVCISRETIGGCDGHKTSSDIELELPRSAFDDYQLGMEFDLVPARTQT